MGKRRDQRRRSRRVWRSTAALAGGGLLMWWLITDEPIDHPEPEHHAQATGGARGVMPPAQLGQGGAIVAHMSPVSAPGQWRAPPSPPDRDLAPGAPQVETLSRGRHRVEVARGELLVQLRPHVGDQRRAQLWDEIGVEVLQHSARLGVYRVRLPEGERLDVALGAMARRPEVLSVDPNAIAYGAERGQVDLSDFDEPLHVEMSDLPTLSPYEPPALMEMMWQAAGQSRLQPDGWPTAWGLVPSASSVTIALLDSGVAADAPSLACADVIEGYDFVNDDADPSDDHQHGTHLASLLLADPSCGALTRGYAVGASLLPVKVLSAELSGTELQVAEGIMYAVEQGADVINMSLSFGLGYLPGHSLQRALRFASDAGVLMVASSGNSGADKVAFPAAAPHVIAVGAYARPEDDASPFEPAAYSNSGAALDILAPGGDLQADADRNGLPDGMLAETFDPAQPDTYGYWMAAGTSQAAVAVTGLAALMLEHGINRRVIRPIISATGYRPDDSFSELYGNGFLRPAFALTYHLHAAYPGDLAMLHHHQVSPVALHKMSQDEAKIRVSVVVRESDAEAERVGLRQGVTLFGHWAGEVSGSVSCSVDAGANHCVVRSDKLPIEGDHLASFFIDRVQPEAAHPLHRWAAPAVGYYGLSQADAVAIMNAEGNHAGLVFQVDPSTDITQHLFGNQSNSACVTYNARNLGPATALPPGVAVLNSEAFALREEEAIAEGNGLGASSLVFNLSWSMVYSYTTAVYYSLGNGLGASSLPSDYSLLINSFSSLLYTNVSSTWQALGNGLGASSLVFDSYSFVTYATESLMRSFYSIGMSEGGDQVGLVPLR